MSGTQSDGEGSDKDKAGKKKESQDEEGSPPEENSSPKKKKGIKEEETKEPSGDDVTVPEGWQRKVVPRKSGKTSGRCDVYFYSPEGQKFRSRIEIATYLAESKSTLQIEEFVFNTRTKSGGDAGTNSVAKAPPVPKKRKAEAKAHRGKKAKEDSENRSTVAKKSPRKFFPESSPAKDTSRSTVAKKQPKRIYVKLFSSPKKRILSDFANETLSKEETTEPDAKATAKPSPTKRGKAKKAAPSSPAKAKAAQQKPAAKLRVQVSAKKGKKKKVK